MDQLRLAASDEMKGREKLTGGLRFTMTALMPIPSSWSQKKQNLARLGLIHHTTTPDLKNLLWLAEDALKSVVYSDDKLICEQRTAKCYSDDPMIVITVEQIDNAS